MKPSPFLDAAIRYLRVTPRYAAAALMLCSMGCPHFGHHGDRDEDGGAPPEEDAGPDAGMDDADAEPQPPDAEPQPPDAEPPPPDAQPEPPDAQPEPPDAQPTDGGTDPETFALRVVMQGLEAPLEITWGPDDLLWITERVGKRVVRVDPVTGVSRTALDVVDAYQSGGQDGVLGMTLHPDLLQGAGTDFVYLAYTYDADEGPALDRRTKIVRYRYDAGSQTLVEPVDVIAGLAGSVDHNSGRLAYGPDDKLYYTIGDQGNNQFDRKCQIIRAQELPTQAEVDQQNWSRYQGKILRLNLDGSIPSDNPVLAGVQSHVYSYGHRNAQGLAFGPDGKLYSDEQGPKTDDEANLILPGRNYGWPHVAGYSDDKAYVYGNWSASTSVPCDELAFSDYVLPPSVPQQRESDWNSPDFMPPLMTFYTVESDYDFMDPACAGNFYMCWPTIAPASLEVYAAGDRGFSSWGTSLLITSLKQGSVFRVRLSPDGTSAVDQKQLFKTINRYRDLTVAPDNRTFYIITDSSGTTTHPAGGFTSDLAHPGAILEYSYTP